MLPCTCGQVLPRTVVPYRKHHDVGLATMTIWRTSRLAATLLRRLLCPCVRVRGPFLSAWRQSPGRPVKQVTEEIVNCVGQWEKIVDAPVPLRTSWSCSRLLRCSRCFQCRSPGDPDLPVPQVMESVELQLECDASRSRSWICLCLGFKGTFCSPCRSVCRIASGSRSGPAPDL